MRFFSSALVVVLAATLHASGLAVSTTTNFDKTLNLVSAETGRSNVDVERRLRGAEMPDSTYEERAPLEQWSGLVDAIVSRVKGAWNGTFRKKEAVPGTKDESSDWISNQDNMIYERLTQELNERKATMEDTIAHQKELLAEQLATTKRQIDEEHKKKVKQLDGQLEAMAVKIFGPKRGQEHASLVRGMDEHGEKLQSQYKELLQQQTKKKEEADSTYKKNLAAIEESAFFHRNDVASKRAKLAEEKAK